MTRARWEGRLLDEIRRSGGVMSVFELTANRFIAHAASRLEARGAIARLRDHPDDRFPRCMFRINEERV